MKKIFILLFIALQCLSFTALAQSSALNKSNGNQGLSPANPAANPINKLEKTKRSDSDQAANDAKSSRLQEKFEKMTDAEKYKLIDRVRKTKNQHQIDVESHEKSSLN